MLARVRQVFQFFFFEKVSAYAKVRSRRLTLTRVTMFAIASGLHRREALRRAEIYPAEPTRSANPEGEGKGGDLAAGREREREREKQGSKVDRKGRALPDVIPQIRSGFRLSEHDRRRIIRVKFVQSRAAPRRDGDRAGHAPCVVNDAPFCGSRSQKMTTRAPRFFSRKRETTLPRRRR